MYPLPPWVAAKWNTTSCPVKSVTRLPRVVYSRSSLTNLILGKLCSRFSRVPLLRLSTTVTLDPSPTRESTRWLPMKLAPPVTRTFFDFQNEASGLTIVPGRPRWKQEHQSIYELSLDYRGIGNSFLSRRPLEAGTVEHSIRITSRF